MLYYIIPTYIYILFLQYLFVAQTGQLASHSMSLQELNTTFEALFSLPILDTLHFLQIKDSNILKDHFLTCLKIIPCFFYILKIETD